jgi:hypothetical protein
VQRPPLTFLQLDNRYSRDFIPIIDPVLTMLPVSPVGQLIGESFCVLHRTRAIFRCINAYPYIEAFNQPQEFSSGSAPYQRFRWSGSHERARIAGRSWKSERTRLARPQ